MTEQQSDAAQLLLSYFRVMGNADRLRIAVQLMHAPASISELAETLGFKRSATAEHVAELRGLELVKPAANNKFMFDLAALLTLNQQVLARENLPTPIDHYGDEEIRKTLRPFFAGMRLREIPEGQRRFIMLLHWLVTQFESGVQYTEKEVNAIIEQFNPDYATLRRGLIDAQLMERDHGIYWRVA